MCLCVCVSVILKIPRFTLSVKSQRFMYLFRLPFIRFISSIFFSLFKSVGFFFVSFRLSSTVVSLLHKLCLSHAHTAKKLKIHYTHRYHLLRDALYVAYIAGIIVIPSANMPRFRLLFGSATTHKLKH